MTGAGAHTAYPEGVPKTPAKPYRQPSFLRFIVTGFVLGFLFGALVASRNWFYEPSVLDQLQYSDGTMVGFLAMIFGLGGALLAAVVAVLIDQWSARRRS